MKVLFLSKQAGPYGGSYSPYGYASDGITNSAQYIADMLRGCGFHTEVRQVVDSNSIHTEIRKLKPNVVILESLWVVPDKLRELAWLSPRVRFIVRLHSDWTFLATEGIAVSWIKEYLCIPHVQVAFTCPGPPHDIRQLTGRHILYLPDFYPIQIGHGKKAFRQGPIRIGLLGHLRPLKNQLIQAVAALRFATHIGRPLELHINSVAQGPQEEEVLKNIRGLFKGSENRLVEHRWMSHDKLLRTLSHMDFSLNVSLSETFGLIVADAVSVGVSIVCSTQIPWAARRSTVANPTDANDIVETIKEFHYNPVHSRLSNLINRIKIFVYSKQSRKLWLQVLFHLRREL